MKFIVTRSSSWDDVQKPCEGAIREKYIVVDTRGTSKPENIPLSPGQSTNWWYEDGTNHRVENGCIARDFEGEGWFIEISSLEELIKFQETVYNSIILSDYSLNHKIKEIEIYDDYRE